MEVTYYSRIRAVENVKEMRLGLREKHQPGYSRLQEYMHGAFKEQLLSVNCTFQTLQSNFIIVFSTSPDLYICGPENTTK